MQCGIAESELSKCNGEVKSAMLERIVKVTCSVLRLPQCVLTHFLSHTHTHTLTHTHTHTHTHIHRHTDTHTHRKPPSKLPCNLEGEWKAQCTLGSCCCSCASVSVSLCVCACVCVFECVCVCVVR